jgi:signal transduction histidine kinase
MSDTLRHRGGAGSAQGSEAGGSLERVRALLAEGAAGELPAERLEAFAERARAVRTAGRGSTDADCLASLSLTADVLLELAADGRLDGDVARSVVRDVGGACNLDGDSTALDLYRRVTAAPGLFDLPPAVAVEIVLRLLLHLGAAASASLWTRTTDGVHALVALETQVTGTPARAAAERALGLRRGPAEPADTTTATVARLGRPYAVVVARAGSNGGLDAYLDVCARALTPLLEREALLARGADREHLVTRASERRLTRLGFDLHDGPVQEVVALAEDLRSLRDELMPFVAETQRELAAGRFDDTLHRLADLDRSLRELANALESRSIVARPLSEILHREVSRFAERSGIDATLEIEGDAEALTPSQRIVVYRAVQESLTNVREHSGARHVALQVRAARGAVDVEVTDDGHGFAVEQALARAAQRGRLGIVGIGERVRMIGGTFEIDSVPGGPTTLRLTLPRWDGITTRADADDG